MEENIMLHKIPMPKIGLTMKRENVAAFPLIVEALELGAKHFDIPLDNRGLWLSIHQHVAKKDLQMGHDTHHKRGELSTKACEELFLSTTIHLRSRMQPDVASLLRSFEPLCMGRAYVDVIFLENPVGLRGSDITCLYKADKESRYPSLCAMFERKPDKPTLKITPNVPQNLGATWKKLVFEAKHSKGVTQHIGLRNFSLGQIKAILKAVPLRPMVVQVELNTYNMQKDLRRVCQANDIVVVALHPFGNPNDIEREGRPLLLRHPTVTSIAQAMKLNPRTILLQYLRQCDIPFIFDLRHYKKITLFKKIKKFALSAEQMNMLSALDRTGLEEDKTELDIWMEKDPVWPFYIQARKPRKSRFPPDVPTAEQEDPDVILPQGKDKYVHFIRKDPKEPPKKHGPKPVPKQLPPSFMAEREAQLSFNNFEMAVKESIWQVLEGQLVHALTLPLARMIHKTYLTKFPLSFCDDMSTKQKERFQMNLSALMEIELHNVDKKELGGLIRPLVKVQNLENFTRLVPADLKIALHKGFEEVRSQVEFEAKKLP